MHEDFVYLYPKFQTATPGAILVQSLKNEDFITPQQTIYLSMN